VDNFGRLFLMVAIPFVAGITMIGPSLIGLLASQDVAHASRWVGPFIAVATIFNGIALIAFQIAFVLGRTRTVLNANAVGSAINIGLNLLLLYFIRDITVPAAVAAISYIACCAAATWSLKDAWKITIRAKSALQFIAASLGMATLLLALGYRPGTILVEPMSQLLVHVALGVIVYGSLLAAIGGVDRRDIRQFRAIFRREAKGARVAS
jgi:O-antigen/teichoic acid export membrane protein